MADTKLTALSEVSVPALTDVAYWVADPAGTPASDKISGTRLGGLLTRAVALGRLTTESGVPVSTSNRTAQGTIYWTPYNGNQIGIYDGTRWKLYTFTEKSLALTGLIPNGVVSNVFIYDNSGTLTLELGHWQNATITVTIASPGVVTWTSHGLSNGDTVVFSTTSALPTGITAGTVYFVVSAAANTFQIAATSGGTAINTSGSQSGTHTGYVNGLGSSSSAVLNTVRNLTTQDGIYVKSGATTRRWLGIIKASGTDVTEQSLTHQFVWNAFNQVPLVAEKLGTTQHTYTTSADENWNASATETFCDMITGTTQIVVASIESRQGNSAGNSNAVTKITVDTVTYTSQLFQMFGSNAVSTGGISETLRFAPGYHSAIVTENGVGTTGTFYEGKSQVRFQG